MDNSFLQRQKQKAPVFIQETRQEQMQRQLTMDQQQFATQQTVVQKRPAEMLENIGISTVMLTSKMLAPAGGAVPQSPVYQPIEKKHEAIRAEDDARMDTIKLAISRYNDTQGAPGPETAERLNTVSKSCRDYGRLRFSILRGARGKHRSREVNALRREIEARTQSHDSATTVLSGQSALANAFRYLQNNEGSVTGPYSSI